MWLDIPEDDPTNSVCVGATDEKIPLHWVSSLNSISRKAKTFLRYAQIVAGKSYYHRPLRLGKIFKAGKLAGYFCDMTVKTDWVGRVDGLGVPLIVLLDGRELHFATTIVQKALGHWDRWLLTRNEEEKNEFLRLCEWLIIHQDLKGGWNVMELVGLSLPSPYSAMTQGQCISAFVRAHSISTDGKFADGARRAFELLTTSTKYGGPMLIEGDSIFLEEVVSSQRSSILNGWIFSLFGLYDYHLGSESAEAMDIYQQSLGTLRSCLPQYDTGYWSFYDACGNIASGFYHDLHIHQLTALALVDNHPIFPAYRNRWLGYQTKFSSRVRAFMIKGVQKLKEPGDAVNVA